MKLTTKLLAVAIVLSGVIACSKSDSPAPPNPKITFKATMSGPQEGASNTSTATGQATLIYDSVTKIFTVSVTHTIAAPTNGHIHKGAAGVAGPVVFPFASYTSPISYTSPALDATQEADLKAGLYYVNIHTATYPGGEIRGQLIRQ
jgi:CHRD domain-containing protein